MGSCTLENTVPISLLPNTSSAKLIAITIQRTVSKPKYIRFLRLSFAVTPICAPGAFSF